MDQPTDGPTDQPTNLLTWVGARDTCVSKKKIFIMKAENKHFQEEG